MSDVYGEWLERRLSGGVGGAGEFAFWLFGLVLGAGRQDFGRWWTAGSAVGDLGRW